MPRKPNKKQKKEVIVDLKHGSYIVQKLINKVMWCGKKNTSTGIVYEAMEFLSGKTGEPALQATEKAINNIKPPIEVRSRRVGGATYQVPVEVRPDRQNALALRWLVNMSRERKEHSMAEKLGKELLDAFNNTGACIKKRTDTVKMAEANKAFAHYRW